MCAIAGGWGVWYIFTLAAICGNHSELNLPIKRLLKLRTFTFCICIGMIGCSNDQRVKHRHFDSLVFTYNDVFTTCFSIKFTQTDTAYISQHFASRFSDSLQSNTTYYTVLSHDDWMALDSFRIAIDFSSFDTSYYESYEDGIDYLFYVQSKVLNKRVRIHSHNGPSELVRFKDWIVTKKESWFLHQCDTLISFQGAEFILPPVPEVSKEKFVLPVVENGR